MTVTAQIWYKNSLLSWLLYPLSLIFQLIVFIRRWFLKQFRQEQFSVPIIVVGNLTVGGTGKTPLVIAIAQQLLARGLKVGIVSRGYGAKAHHFPLEVYADTDAGIAGDEPVLIAKNTHCPVVIDPNRVQAVKYLLAKHQPQIILSDDGLQHYRMGRKVEIVVIDGLRGLGNRKCLPAGPLREGWQRIRQVDFIIVNEGTWPEGYSMNLLPGKLTSLMTGQMVETAALTMPVAAVAGIGNPQRFFNTLSALDIHYQPYPFPDHHTFKSNELAFVEKTIVMTEKDAVKCHLLATGDMYFLPVEAKVSDRFWDALWSHEQLQGYV